MINKSISQGAKKGQDICQNFFEDIRLPLDPILTYLRAAEPTDKGTCPHITDILF